MTATLTIPTWTVDQWSEPPALAPAHARAHAPASGAALARAEAVAARLPPSVEGHGGDLALLRCASEVATILGPDPDAILDVLNRVFAPRCLPPWPPAKLAREAQRAAERQATPEASYVRARRAGPALPDSGDPWDACESWLGPEDPIAYVCEGLRLAPARGKISVLGGQPGGAKGPIADHLAVCFALGLPAFGDPALACVRQPVLLVDCEGSRLTARRVRRMARAVGHDPGELEGWLRLVDASTFGDLTQPCHQDSIARIVDDGEIGVIVLDSYTTAMLASGVDANSPQFALLAQLLGRLDRLVLAVAHANKASARDEPRLSDLAYSGAFAALAQTAILAHYPDDNDKNHVTLACARAPETGFAPFGVRFVDRDDGSLAVERKVVATPAPAMARRDLAKVRDQMARVTKHANQLEALLRDVDVSRAGMSATKLRAALGLTGREWNAARAEVLKRETVTEGALPSDKCTKYRLKE